VACLALPSPQVAPVEPTTLLGQVLAVPTECAAHLASALAELGTTMLDGQRVREPRSPHREYSQPSAADTARALEVLRSGLDQWDVAELLQTLPQLQIFPIFPGMVLSQPIGYMYATLPMTVGRPVKACGPFACYSVL
jgi:hypothetical protein